MIEPRIMCRQHLLGEHLEIHMFVGTIDRGKTVKGYLERGLLEVHNLYARHDELVEEMKRRGYRHCSDVDEKWRTVEKRGTVDRKESLEELLKRCPRCNHRYVEVTSSLK